MNIDWENFKLGKFGVCCRTEEHANDFLKQCENQGILCDNKEKPTKVKHRFIHKEQACYSICHGVLRADFSGFIRLIVIIYEPTYPSIHITTDGVTTTCTMAENGQTIRRTQAKCSPEDKFDFKTGARIAFDRCCTSPTQNSTLVKKETFRPHLKYIYGKQSHTGNIGEPTNQTAFGGKRLFIGDCVNLYDIGKRKYIGVKVVAKKDHYPNGFIMGAGCCNFVNGVCGDLQIQKVKSFKDLKDGETIDSIKVVLTDEN